MKARKLSMIAVLVVACLAISNAHAGFVVNIVQSGSNVVATGSGSLNTQAWTYFGSNGPPPGFNPAAFIEVGTLAPPYLTADYDAPVNFSGPAGHPIGGGGLTYPSATTGDLVFLAMPTLVVGGGETDGSLTLPQNYVSGAALSDSSTFDNATFTSLGITPGTYVWTWGSGVTADSFTLNVGSTVPEPASLSLIAIGGVAFLSRRRRNVLNRGT